MRVTHIAICGPDEEQSGFVALTMRVESAEKEKHLIHCNSLIKHLILKLTHIQWIVMQQQSHTFEFYFKQSEALVTKTPKFLLY